MSDINVFLKTDDEIDAALATWNKGDEIEIMGLRLRFLKAERSGQAVTIYGEALPIQHE